MGREWQSRHPTNQVSLCEGEAPQQVPYCMALAPLTCWNNMFSAADVDVDYCQEVYGSTCVYFVISCFIPFWRCKCGIMWISLVAELPVAVNSSIPRRFTPFNFRKDPVVQKSFSPQKKIGDHPSCPRGNSENIISFENTRWKYNTHTHT